MYTRNIQILTCFNKTALNKKMREIIKQNLLNPLLEGEFI